MSIQFGKEDALCRCQDPLKLKNRVLSLMSLPSSLASYFPNLLLWIVWRKCRPGTTRTRNIIYWLLRLSLPPPFLTLQCRRTEPCAISSIQSSDAGWSMLVSRVVRTIPSTNRVEETENNNWYDGTSIRNIVCRKVYGYN